MALWYKAWRESRVRFLIGAVTVAFFSIVAARVNLETLPFRPLPTFPQYIWRAVYDGPPAFLFGVFAAILGLGGLRWERTTGSQAFTLALPATRRRLMLVRSMMALGQVAALSCIPLVTVPTVSRFYQDAPYPVHQAAMFASLFLACGAAWCAAGILWSSLVSNEHAAAAACVLTPFAGRAFNAVAGVHSHADLFQVMNGVATLQISPTTRFLHGPMPWVTLLLVTAVGTALILSACRVVDQQDF